MSLEQTSCQSESLVLTAAWQPLVEGADAELAHEAIAAIALELEALEPTDASLYHGQAGIALFHGYRARAGEARALDAAGDALAFAVQGGGEEHLPFLARGFAGTGFALAQLSDLIDPGSETLDEYDRAIAWVLERDPWPFEWELIVGLIGLGVYGLERAGTAAGRAMVERVLGHLTARAAIEPGGATWLAPVREGDLTGLSPRDTATYYNLGLPYGVLGAVSFLAAARRAGMTGPEARLLEEATRWLRGHDRPDAEIRFPGFIAGGRAQSRRNGWCYGDPIAAAALVGAGLAAGEPDWVGHGVDVALQAARWDARTGHMENGLSFCHGTAGRAHLLNRVAQATGSSELADAARTAYRALLAAREPGSGIGGFHYHDAVPGFERGVQLGAAGLGLCLLAGISAVAPDWDRAFLSELPPRG
jgi:hypothetical protein